MPRVCRLLQSRDRKGAIAGLRFPQFGQAPPIAPGPASPPNSVILPVESQHEVISMSAVRATGAEIHNAAPAAGTPEAVFAHKSHHYMLLIREIEDRNEHKLQHQGKVGGGVYVGRGQEAIPVGSALVAEAQDVLFPSHRDMAVFFIRGVSARRVM